MIGVDLVVAGGGDDQHGVERQLPADRGEQFEGRAVGPVDVLERDQHRATAGQGAQGDGDRADDFGLDDVDAVVIAEQRAERRTGLARTRVHSASSTAARRSRNAWIHGHHPGASPSQQAPVPTSTCWSRAATTVARSSAVLPMPASPVISVTPPPPRRRSTTAWVSSADGCPRPTSPEPVTAPS